jgi:rare lipoprotein A (peptidoglycan hydrolase)
MILTLLAAISFLPKCEISVYSPSLEGSPMAYGGKFRNNRYTCATPSRGAGRLAPGTRIRLHYKGKSVIVTVTDNGSYRPKRAAHWFDLSAAAAKQLMGKNYYTRVVGNFEVLK